MKVERKVCIGYELEFISQIRRNGSGVVICAERPTHEDNDRFVLNRLSITEDTWIACGFNSYVVKLKL